MVLEEVKASCNSQFLVSALCFSVRDVSPQPLVFRYTCCCAVHTTWTLILWNHDTNKLDSLSCFGHGHSNRRVANIFSSCPLHNCDLSLCRSLRSSWCVDGYLFQTFSILHDLVSVSPPLCFPWHDHMSCMFYWCWPLASQERGWSRWYLALQLTSLTRSLLIQHLLQLDANYSW